MPTSEPNAKLRTLDNIPVKEKCFGSIRDTIDALKNYEGVHNFSYYGMTNWVYNYIAQKFPEDIDYDFNLIKIGKIDIETTVTDGFPDVELAKEKIWVITLSYQGKYHVFYDEFWGNYTPHNEKIVVHPFPDEQQMLQAFLQFWIDLDLDIVTGWNSEGFDIPYIVNRMKNVLGEQEAKKLSPLKIIAPKEYNISTSRTVKTYDILGINHIDMLEAYKKFGLHRPENYKLDTVCHEELGSGKLDFSEIGTIHDIYLRDFQKAIEYNIRDVELLELLDKKKDLLNLIVNLSLSMKVSMLDTFKQTRMWDQHIHCELLKEGIVIPSGRDEPDKNPFEGAYVKEPIPGLYEWNVSVDGTSLYPHIIMGWNISPETYRGKDEIHPKDFYIQDDSLLQIQKAKANNWAVAGNGAYFDRSIDGFLPKLMKKMFDERKKFKGKMLEFKKELEAKRSELSKDEIRRYENEISKYSVLEQGKKVSLNSAYGTVSSPGFRYFSRDIGEGITLSGQLILRWGEERINKFLNQTFKTTNESYVFYGDTDSLYITLKKLIDIIKEKVPNLSDQRAADALDKFCKDKLQPKLDKIFNDLAIYVNAKEQKINFKRESIIKSQIQIAKKKYLYNIIDKEGVRYQELYLGVTGVEIVRSSTPEFCRDKLREASKIILSGDQEKLLEYIERTKEEFYNLPVESIATPKSVSDVSGYTGFFSLNGDVKPYGKGTPIHSKGSIIYNQLLKDHSLEKSYPKISDGDKIRYTYLKVPNPIFEEVISFPDILPKEFGLEKYIDYDLQWEKMFMSPIKMICDTIEMQIDGKVTLF